MSLPVKSLSQGIFRTTQTPAYGQQHKGISPGGAMDLFSLPSGNLILKNPEGSPALEIIYAPKFKFTSNCCFIITGAKYAEVKLYPDSTSTDAVTISHGQVGFARKGYILELLNKHDIGFRSYLCVKKTNHPDPKLIQRSRNDYEPLFDWMDKDGRIRVIEGPEYQYLENKETFTNTCWLITNDFSTMGFRLSTRDEGLSVNLKNMVSEAVADGTVQLTPKGPIILLRDRQTVGGYPRIFNVINADLDLLGQYAPNQIIKFSKTGITEALEIEEKKRATLNRIKALCSD